MSESNKKQPEAPGCQVTKADTPLIVASVACYAAFAVYGACVSALGAALPSLAEATGKSKSAFGIAFTTRGIGYLIGTLLSAWILSKDLSVSKQFMTCLALAITGVATAIISGLHNFVVVLILFFVQGIGFGGIDVMANCVMPELWALRVQPWMQALHSFFGIGAIIGPAMVGSIGYQDTFIIIALCSFVPLAGLGAVYIYDLKRKLLHEKMSRMSEREDTVSVATAQSVDLEGTEVSEEPATASVENTMVPLVLKLLITSFYFVYVGAESGYAGWIPTFALDEGVTDSYSKAAYLSSYFWAALTAGRVLAILVAVFLSATAMLRVQLAIAAVSSVLVVLIANTTYANTAGVSGFLGFALSSIFPLAMTIVSDYGYTMDSATTTLFMVAATLGESIIPVCMGIAISQSGAMSLTYITLAAVAMLCMLYGGMHHIGGRSGLQAVTHSSSNSSSKAEGKANRADQVVLESSSFSSALQQQSQQGSGGNNATQEEWGGIELNAI